MFFLPTLVRRCDLSLLMKDFNFYISYICIHTRVHIHGFICGEYKNDLLHEKEKNMGFFCLKIINLKGMWIVKVEELGIKTDDGISFLKGVIPWISRNWKNGSFRRECDLLVCAFVKSQKLWDCHLTHHKVI